MFLVENPLQVKSADMTQKYKDFFQLSRLECNPQLIKTEEKRIQEYS